MSNKEKYRVLCTEEEDIPLFCQAWWLEAVADDDWDVVLVEKDNKIFASMPYVKEKRWGLTIIGQAPLTQHLGPWLRPSHAKYAKKLGQEKDLLQSLFAQLPKFDYFRQNWNFNYTNWLPLYWRGFEQTTRYTYRIENIKNIEPIWSNFQENIRGDIKKALHRENLIVRTDLELKDFIELNEKVFIRQRTELPYTKELVQKIDSAANNKKAKKIFIAEDPQGRRHAGVYLVWDSNSAYYLMGGGDPLLRNSGATSLCMWEAIKFASGVTRSFDFEGSMIEPVERFFRAFGARQVPYFYIKKANSRMLKFYEFMQSLQK